MTDASFVRGDAAFPKFRNAILSGEAEPLYPVGEDDLAKVEVAAGRVMMIGAPPGAGKTALVMQMAFDAVRLTPELRACICNIEMSPQVLLERQLARLSGIDATTIRKREFTSEHGERLRIGLDAIEAHVDQLCFVRAPYDLENVAQTVDEFRADILVLDYIQRIKPPGDHGDKRGSVDATMDYIRQFADAGMAVIVISAVARTKDKKNRSSYDAGGLSLASFRESSELEYGADDAYILDPSKKDDSVTLRHLKARHGRTEDLQLVFDKEHQSFTSAQGNSDPGARESLAALWNSTAAAAATGGAQ